MSQLPQRFSVSTIHLRNHKAMAPLMHHAMIRLFLSAVAGVPPQCGHFARSSRTR